MHFLEREGHSVNNSISSNLLLAHIIRRSPHRYHRPPDITVKVFLSRSRSTSTIKAFSGILSWRLKSIRDSQAFSFHEAVTNHINGNCLYTPLQNCVLSHSSLSVVELVPSSYYTFFPLASNQNLPVRFMKIHPSRVRKGLRPLFDKLSSAEDEMLMQGMQRTSWLVSELPKDSVKR